jgi:hypothetical protein
VSVQDEADFREVEAKGLGILFIQFATVLLHTAVNQDIIAGTFRLML